MSNLKANETPNLKKSLPNGLDLKCMSNPTKAGYTDITVTGVLMESSIRFVGDISDHPDDLPLTVLHFFGAIQESSPRTIRVHVFGPNGAFGVGSMKGLDNGKHMLHFNALNRYRDTFVQLFERV